MSRHTIHRTNERNDFMGSLSLGDDVLFSDGSTGVVEDHSAYRGNGRGIRLTSASPDLNNILGYRQDHNLSGTMFFYDEFGYFRGDEGQAPYVTLEKPKPEVKRFFTGVINKEGVLQNVVP